MSRSEVARMLELGRDHNCKEALFTLGEQPESVREIRNELRKWGYSSIAEYLLDLCKDALKYGLLPHSNIGVSTPEDLRALKDVNASMGLMLESASERLCGEGMPHEFSPGKRPDIRLGFIEEAGKLGIPFTTGLLIGIGETDEEIVESLIALRKLHERFGHIQELIVQNFVPHPGTRMEKAKAPSFERMLKTLYVSKAALPGVSIQVPPNLHKDWRTFIAYGADDLGGISPVTEDYINPGHAWPDLKHVESVITGMGLNLRQRLPIYPKYIKLGWYSDEIAHLIESYTDEDGLVKDVVID
jgi:7,8-didemethyl-8-hydroxy-5-deazariboflavin synthase CofG subunit